MSTEHAVGETFVVNEQTYKVVECETWSETCNGCAFDGEFEGFNNDCCVLKKRGLIGPCTKRFRKDGKSVIFVKV